MIKIYLLRFSSLLLMLFFVITVSGQTISVQGTVKESDANGTLSGVSVYLKGKTATGTTTDENGKYKLSVEKGSTLVFSFVGYDNKSVAIGDRTIINVTLNPSSTKALGDVVVIGYKKTTQRTTTAAVTVISGKEIENMPAPSLESALQGKVSGVNIQNFSGEPGVRSTFVVRGNTSVSTNLDAANALSAPLYVIDGVPLSITDISNFNDNTNTNVIAGININDIESIQVQKDAAATAIWGSRGANGVVIIKTKDGKKGKPQFTLNAYGGFTGKPDLAQTMTGTAERKEKMDLLLGYDNYKGLWNLPQILTDSLNPAFNNATDWQGLFYRSGFLRNVDMSVAGATDAINYRFSLNNYDEDGVVRGTGFSRYTMRANLGFNLSPKLSSQLNISLNRIDRKRGLGGSSPWSNIPIDLINMPASFYKLTPLDNARYHGQYDKLRDKNQNNSVMAFASLNYKILPSLQYSLQGSVTSNGIVRDYMQPSVISPNGQSYAEADRTDDYTYNVNNVLTFTKSFHEKHNINLLAIQSFERQEQNYVTVYGSDLPSDNIQVVQGVSQLNLGGSSDYRAASLLSYAFQGHYDFKEKYLFDFSVRADASSRFGAANKWGYFPSVSAGYIISDEPFFKSVKWVSMLKFRGSWGINGIQPSDFYAPWNSYNTSQGFYNGVNMATPDYSKGATQPDLTWEPTTQWNIGMDAYLLNHHLNVTVDVYDKETRNMYYTFPLSFTTGYNNQTSNSQLAVRNSGIEVNIDTRNMPSGSKLQWNTNFNFSFNKNLIAKLPNEGRSINPDGSNTIFTQGQPIYEFFQMIYKGVYTSDDQVPVNPLTGQKITYFKTYRTPGAGYPIWVDANKDWDVWGDENFGTTGDLVPSGDPNPKITGGFNNTLTYGNFSLSIGCAFTRGRDIINTFLQRQFDNWGWSNGAFFANTRIPDLTKIDYYRPPAPGKTPAELANYHPKYPQIDPNSSYYYEFFPFSSMFNENGNYFKITNISFGYRLPKKLLESLKISSFRAYIMLDNVHTFQNSSVPNAEQVDPFGAYYGGSYPIPKKLTIGITVQF